MVKERDVSCTPNSDDSSNSEECSEIVDSNTELLRKSKRRSRVASGDCEDNHSSSAKHLFQQQSKEGYEQMAADPIPNNSSTSNVLEGDMKNEISLRRKYLTIFVLFLINLLNYMDRFTIAGILIDIMGYFHISNAMGGLLQTVFIISYMVAAPIFGYLGDRYNRKLVMLAGMLVWSGCTLGASFINDEQQFLYFLILRGLVGIGEASYSTIAPTIIADLFVKSQRTRMLSVFFFAIPVGSGLGYIIGAGAAKAGGSWHWALRVTPGLGVLTMLLMILIIPTVKRGASEDHKRSISSETATRSSYLDDLKYILKNKSFMLVTIAFTFMAFVVGSLTIWGPVYVAYSQVVIGALLPCTADPCEYGSVSFTFGIITCVAGFTGVWMGAESAKKWKERGQKNADALVCGIGLVSAAPFLLVGFLLATISLPVAWLAIFIADLFLCLTWTLVGDMTLYVTMPNRRSTANAVQIFTMHLFGDAGSPYLLGVMSDSLQDAMPDAYYSKYLSMQRAMYVTLFASVFGGFCFFLASLFVENDKKKVDDCLGNTTPTTSSSSTSNTTVKANLVSCENGEEVPSNRQSSTYTQVYITPDNCTNYSINDNAHESLLQDDNNHRVETHGLSTSLPYISIGANPPDLTPQVSTLPRSKASTAKPVIYESE